MSYNNKSLRIDRADVLELTSQDRLNVCNIKKQDSDKRSLFDVKLYINNFGN